MSNPLNNCVDIKKTPINPKNNMSFPLDDPIKNKCVIGWIIGFKILLMKSTPAIIINRIPTNIVLFIFIKNNIKLIIFKLFTKRNKSCLQLNII